MNATIYIPDEQEHLYSAARIQLGDSLSKIIVRCLERELENMKLKAERIVVEIYDEHSDRRTKKAFEGSFIIGSEAEGEEFSFEEGSEITMMSHGGYAVAVTKASRIVVLEFDRDDNATDLQVYDDFEEFQNATMDNGRYPSYPESLIQAVASDLGIEHIENLDI